ncbi:hypothetical protein [Rhodanobacter ginsenosidimutans]|uniref:Uncharacterized protein n=1 Tax=Rhodanobacter ginsenosidimutans TaxID=490571 RepID=A0ABW0JVZ8_9GAMM
MTQPARWRSNGFRRREGGFDKLADPRGAGVTITPYPGTPLPDSDNNQLRRSSGSGRRSINPSATSCAAATRID